MLTLLASLALLQTVGIGALPVRAAVTFDSPGARPDAILQSLKSGTSAMGELPGRRVAEPTPIVATVAGIDPERLGVWVELGHLEMIWRWLFPDKPKAMTFAKEASAVRLGLSRGDFEFMGPNDYLADAARGVAEHNRLSYDVVNIPWSRDPSDTVVEIERIKTLLSRLSDAAHGRPLYLVGHSWGSVLAREALERLAAEGHPVPVRRFVSFGSALGANRPLTWLFIRYHRLVHGLSWSAAKPQGVELWVNFWAASDPYSGVVPKADANVQVDPEVAPLVERIKRAGAGGIPWNIVERDLYALTNAGRWHGSYFNGFKASLASLRLEIAWDTPKLVVGALTP